MRLGYSMLLLVSLVAPFMMAGCVHEARKGPVTWAERERSANPTPGGAPEAASAPARTQSYYDGAAANEYTYTSCTKRARGLLLESEDAANQMLMGCMKRPDYRDITILREKPFYAAFRRAPERWPLVLKVLGRRDEVLIDELAALRLPMAPASAYINNPNRQHRTSFVVRGRVFHQWSEGNRHMVVVMERAKHATGRTYTSYRTRIINGRVYRYTVQNFVPYRSRYNRGAATELKDTGLLVFFVVDRPLKVRDDETYLFLGRATRERVRDKQVVSLPKRDEPILSDGRADEPRWEDFGYEAGDDGIPEEWLIPAAPAPAPAGRSLEDAPSLADAPSLVGAEDEPFEVDGADDEDTDAEPGSGDEEGGGLDGEIREFAIGPQTPLLVLDSIVDY